MGGSESHTKIICEENIQMLQDLEEIIFDLDEKNIDRLVESSLNYFSVEFPYSFYHIICRIVYSYFVSTSYEELCFKYLKSIEKKSSYNIINIFTQFLLKINSQESNYLLEKMIEDELIDPNIIQHENNPYFIHNFTENILQRSKRLIYQIEEKFQKNGFELHKKYVKEGHNPNEIARIIRNDEIEKLQEISSQTNFDFNQTIKPSLYEKCSFINKEDVTLIAYAAFFSAEKCFKYLLINGSDIENTGKYAVASGNEEIIHLCEQNHSSFQNAYETAIEFHRNDIFKYIYEKKFEEIYNLEVLGKECILHDNFNLFSFLVKEGMKINNTFINTSIITGNIFIFQCFPKKFNKFFGNFRFLW